MDWPSSKIYWNNSRPPPVKNILIRNASIDRQSIASGPRRHKTIYRRSLDHDLQSEIHCREMLGASRPSRGALENAFDPDSALDRSKFFPISHSGTRIYEISGGKRYRSVGLSFPKISLDNYRGGSPHGREWEIYLLDELVVRKTTACLSNHCEYSKPHWRSIMMSLTHLSLQHYPCLYRRVIRVSRRFWIQKCT
jgi:hypothetical protein